MAIPATFYESVLETKRLERSAAFAAQQRAVADLQREDPRLAQVENAQLSIGSKLAICALTGDKELLQQLQAQSAALAAEKAAILGPDLSTPPFACPACMDTGYRDGRLCDCVEAAAQQLYFESLSHQMPLEGSTFDNFSLELYATEADASGYIPREVAAGTLKVCQNFVKGFPEGKNLLFLGNPGLGKTHLSMAIANELLKKGHTMVYGSAQNIIDSCLKERFSYSGSTAYIDGCLGCDLLILDDLGTELQTAASLSVIYNLINSRMQAGRSTIISTNLTLKELEARYEPRICSRIVGGYTLRAFIGNDIRQIKKHQK